LRDAQTTRVNQVMLSLPLCCLVQMALVRLLRSWGINPTAVTGHSSGEVGAAFAANAINMREALAVVWSRGTLTEEFQRKIQRKGGMLAAGLSRAEAAPYLEGLTCSGKAVVACVNSPSSVTLSGDVNAIVELDIKLKRQNIFARRLKVDAAYHSEHMEVFADYYLDYLMERMSNDGDFDGVVFSSPTTGKRIAKAQDLGPAHWVENMVKPVEFLDSFTNMCIDTTIPESDPSRKSIDIVVEIGPHGALSGPIRQILQTPELKGIGVQYGSCLTRGQDAVMTMQNLAALLVSKGFPVNLDAVNFPSRTSRLPVLHDLPSYPWNHQTRYWSEPRLNRQHRLREHPDHDLLGVRVVGTNPATPTWRHIIRQKELPWVTDHRVQSTVIYPAAGYVCMAIEGARQYLGAKSNMITGFRCRDIDIASALIIPDTNEGIEAQLQLRSCDDDNTLGCEGWYEFHISSVTATDEWSHHCRGFISVTTTTGESEKRMVDKLNKMSFENKISAKPSQIFESIHRLGVQHGPIFQNLTQVEADDESQSLVRFKLKNTAELMPDQYEHEHVLHPTTLDSTVVAAFTALPGAGLNQTTGMIPQHIGSLFVSADAPHTPETQLQVLTNISESTPRGFMSSSITWAQDGSRRTPVLEIGDLYFKALGDTGNANSDEGSGKLCATVKWSRSLTHVPNEDLKEMIAGVSKPENLDWLSDLKVAAFYFIRLALENLDDADVDKLTGAHRKFYDWMVQQNKLAKLNELGAQSLAWLLASDEDREALVTSLRHHSVSSQMLCRVGENIVPILKGEVTALELMLEGGLLYKFYEEDMRVVRSHEHLKKYLSMYVHENPRANIIELGAGVGGCTQAALQILGGADEPQFAHYDFTDISAGFFSTARERFSSFGDRINYRKLDLEIDPSEQSFETGSYDLVIACRVLHATKLMSKTMSHVRKLLKPGGKLIIIEDTTNSLDHQVIYGVLPGWWLAEEDDRKQSATMPVTTWDSILQHSGFNSLELEVPAFEEEEYQSSSFMVSTAVASSPASYDPIIYAVHSSREPPAEWIPTLGEEIFKLTGSRLESVQLGSVDLTDKTCLFLEIEEPMLASPSAEKYAELQAMLLTSKGVLWVTRGAAVDSKQPMLALSQGLLRALRCENPAKRYISLDLDAARDPWTAADTSVISRVLQSTFDLTVETSPIDFEYAERGDSIQVPRLVERPDMDEIATGSGDPEVTLQPFLESDELHLEAIHSGDVSSLAFRSSTGREPLPTDFVEIVPHAFGANQSDISVALGQADDSVAGLEVAGTVTRVGNSITDLSVGQRVCALVLQGSYSNLVRVPATNVAVIPDSLSFEVAATLPIAFVTAYSALYEFARLRQGETVLIHNAMGDIGQAAVCLARLAGAEVITTASTPEEHTLLSKALDVPVTHVFSCSDASFARGIMELTSGKGVDVVLSSLSGELLRESWNCIAPFGRFCQIGKHDAQANRTMEMTPFQRMTSFATIDAVYLAQHQPDSFRRVLAEVATLTKKQRISPIEPITAFGISQIEQAFAHLQNGHQTGKTVITVNPDEQVKVILPELSAQLSPDRSYLIVGGMGGIGQAISKHLVQLGARNLILVSRSAEKQIESSQAFLKDLKASGCTVCVRSCDVTNEADLQRVVAESEQETAPVGGVIQAAMVLRVSHSA
jgi:NADPH:quinone reductase-like Zn-dependent oxidoreductase/acyl transferase domain-containing protein